MTEADVVEVLGEQFSLPVADAERLAQADRAAVQLIPETLAREAQVLALRPRRRHARGGRRRPARRGLARPPARAHRLQLKVWIARPSEVREAIEELLRRAARQRAPGRDPRQDRPHRRRATSDEDVDLAALRQQVEDAPVVRLVNLMIAEAIDQRASDIHVEPLRDRVTVRFRIDGVLHEVMKPPKNLQMAIISRIKVLADLDIAVRLLPQDGRLTVHLPDREVDLRVSTLPTSHGEKVVHAPVRQGRVRARDRQPRPRGRDAGRVPPRHPPALRHDPHLRPDRQRQDHHALLGAAGHQERAPQPGHGRGPDRVPHRGRQPGAREPQGRHDLRARAALDPAPGPRRHHDRRDPRHRDGRHRGEERAHRPPRVLDRARQRRARHADAADRHGRAPLPGGLGACRW